MNPFETPSAEQPQPDRFADMARRRAANEELERREHAAQREAASTSLVQSIKKWGGLAPSLKHLEALAEKLAGEKS